MRAEIHPGGQRRTPDCTMEARDGLDLLNLLNRGVVPDVLVLD
jgi:hypothetical protein